MSIFSLKRAIKVHTQVEEMIHEPQKFFVCAWLVVLGIYYERHESED